MVPIVKIIILGSLSKILLGEYRNHAVETPKSNTKETKGLIASEKLLIFPVLSLYDLK